MEDPKELLFGFNGEDNLSPIDKDSQEKEEIQARPTSDDMDGVMKVIKKKQSKSNWEVKQQGNATPPHETSSGQINKEQDNYESEIQVDPNKTGTRPKDPNTTWRKTFSSKHMINFGPIDPNGSIFKDGPANKEADTRTHEEHIESPGRRNHHRLPPTNLTKRETQFQHGDQDFSSSTQSLERNPTSNENHEINQNQILNSC